MTLVFNIIDPFVKLLGESGKILSDITFASILLRLALAIIFGGWIGIDRATKRHSAGLRTYILVCLGSTIVMLTNQYLYQTFETGDVARLGAQVISGIGFLGAGTILVTSRSQIKGLTTAAGLWACACVGLTIGIGFYTLAIIAFILVAIVISILPKLEQYFTSRSGIYSYHVEFISEENLKPFI